MESKNRVTATAVHQEFLQRCSNPKSFTLESIFRLEAVGHDELDLDVATWGHGPLCLKVWVQTTDELDRSSEPTGLLTVAIWNPHQTTWGDFLTIDLGSRLTTVMSLLDSKGPIHVLLPFVREAVNIFADAQGIGQVTFDKLSS